MSSIPFKIPYQKINFRVDPSWTLFLDRDGVINECAYGQYITSWEKFKFLPGALEALEILASIFHKICVVTNQACIEKELLSHEQLHEIHEQMLEVIQYHGGNIDEIYYCPSSAATNSLCRKPNPGMAIQAQKDFPTINFKKCLMVGDMASDIAFANNLGMKSILIGNGVYHEPLLNAIPDAKMDSLLDVARYLSS